MPATKPILVVEDDANDLELTIASLKQIGLANDIVVARDGGEAMDYLRRHGKFRDRVPGLPAVVFLDLKMPRVNGLECLREIKKDEELQVIPVVMLTSSREQIDVAKSYRLGANAYVVKPVDFKAFAEAIRKVGSFWALVNEPHPA